MNVTVDAKAFRGAVAWLARFVPGRPHMPEYAGIRLAATGHNLTLTAFDGDTSAQVKISVDLGEAGTVAVSGRLLTALAANLPARGSVIVSIDGNTLVLAAGAAVMTSTLMPAITQSPPQLPTVAMVDTDAIVAATKRVAPAASKDGFNGDLTQVHLQFADDRFTAMAMDGSRAACVHGVATLAGGEASITIAAKVLEATVGTFGTTEVEIGANGQLASFSGGQHTIVTRQWGQPYRTKVVLTALGWDPDAYALVATKQLQEALKRAMITRTEAEPTELEWSENMLTVSGHGANEVTTAESLIVEYDGPTARILVNPILLSDALAGAGGEQARIGFMPTNTIRPLRITDPEDEDYVHVLVPIRPILPSPYDRKRK